MTEAFAWAVIAPDWASPPNFIHTGTVRPTRRAAMEAFGATGDPSDPAALSKGWKRLYRRGWRLERVVIRRFGQPNTTGDA